MNQEDQEQIRKIIKEELKDALYSLPRTDIEYFEDILRQYSVQLNRFSCLNKQLSLTIKNAGTLMKGCKYEKNTIDDVAVRVKCIYSKLNP